MCDKDTEIEQLHAEMCEHGTRYELADCPFCGSDQTLCAPADEEEKVWLVSCGVCLAQGPIHDNEKAAVWAWNYRAALGK